jgi:hypothetical protein
VINQQSTTLTIPPGIPVPTCGDHGDSALVFGLRALSYRDVEEVPAERGITVDQVTVIHTPGCDLREWVWERTANPSADAFQGSNP